MGKENPVLFSFLTKRGVLKVLVKFPAFDKNQYEQPEAYSRYLHLYPRHIAESQILYTVSSYGDVALCATNSG